MRIIGSQKGLIECKSSIIFESEKRGIFFIISINLGEKYPITPKRIGLTIASNFSKNLIQ